MAAISRHSHKARGPALSSFAALRPTYGAVRNASALLELLQALPGLVDDFLALAVLQFFPSLDL